MLVYIVYSNTFHIFQVFKILNEIYKAFDERISSFDVYKVESINEKYMVASGVPKQNGQENYLCILDVSKNLIVGFDFLPCLALSSDT